MWVFTLDGFYSAVEHDSAPGWLTVRSRTEADAQRLADWLNDHTDAWTEVRSTPSGDYGWRLTVRKDRFASYLVAASESIDYRNFKNAVQARLGPDRARIYGDVWADLLELQHPLLRSTR